MIPTHRLLAELRWRYQSDRQSTGCSTLPWPSRRSTVYWKSLAGISSCSSPDGLALLVHHPANWFAQTIAHWGDGLTVDTEHFASAYLIAHGVAKVFIAWGLFREKLWAFPTALVVFGLLITYQLYRFAHTHSPTLAFLIALDVAVCYLIWREYGFRREG